MKSDQIKLIIADLDGTLSRSKQPIDPEMAQLLFELLDYKAFAIISGGSYAQFQKQFISNLKIDSKKASRLYLFPTCATSMYVMRNKKWQKVYGTSLSAKSKKQIISAFGKALDESKFKMPKKIYGELIEDRETQITFSAFGQLAPFEIKSVWDIDGKKRKLIIKNLVKYLPRGFEAKAGGTSSIDVTKRGIDKAYGINKIRNKLGYKTKQMLFLGDMLQKGGNDYPVKTTGVKCIEVDGPDHTKKIIRKIIERSK